MDGLMETIDGVETDNTVAPNRRTAHSSGVTVKGLEWREVETNWWTVDPKGLGFGYEVRLTDRGTTRVRMPAQHWDIFEGSPDEAKAAAQADYERRILSAISTAEAGVEGDAKPVGYIDKHRQKFASTEKHDAETLVRGGWTPVFTHPPLLEESSRLRAAISWIEPPFVDDQTPQEELFKRVALCVNDARFAARSALGRNAG